MVKEWEKRQKNFHRIYEQITLSPGIPIYEIAEKTGLSRNTVSKYLGEMYEDMVLIGPQIRVLPAPNYKEYAYFLNFKNPYYVFQNLHGFPHILWYAVTYGDWNLMVITDGLVDFSQLTGYEKTVYQGIRYHSATPKTDYVLWGNSFEKAFHEIETFKPYRENKDRELAPVLDWGEDEWKMYHAFRSNTRKTATTTLKQIRVRYESYVKWSKDLDTHCSVHTGFYPEGYPTYLTYCFLFSTYYEQTVKRIFSHLPTTPFFMEVGDQFMVFTSMALSGIVRKLFCSIFDMKTQGIIKDFDHVTLLFQAKGEPLLPE
ncbi:MAG: winged helix-turn-helix domain-containing protein [Candidatus Methanofastidiosia archaeon]